MNAPACQAASQATSRQLLIVGTDTEVGKTHVTATMARGLRQLGRRVWLYKPVACGDWDGLSAGDGRSLAALAEPEQPAESVCPYQFAPACSPHLAAAESGVELRKEDLLRGFDACVGPDHDLLCEGAGGLLSPLGTDDCDIMDLARERNLPCILVTRPDLGTLNHTRLSVAVARSRKLRLVGLLINQHRPLCQNDPAVRSAASELARLCQLPVLAVLPYQEQEDPPLAKRCAEIILSHLERESPSAG